MPSLDINTIFQKAVDGKASDIHLYVGRPPMARYDGSLQIIEGYEEPLSADDIASLTQSILEQGQWERLKEERELDCSYQVPNSGERFRINCHFERGYMGLIARIIPQTIPSMEEMLPSVAYDLIKHDRGIVLCTGPTGSGKSTTLAAMINQINAERPVHILTLEDPIEFLYNSQKAVVRQRQLGTDFLSFPEAMRRVLRQDPDVILVGEMRDLETIGAALTLAETGHLVFGTLHTSSAAQTIDRIIDVFPPHQQSQIRTQLSTVLRGIIAQYLVTREGGGRCAVREILVGNPAVGNIIRDNRIHELSNVLQTSADEGMVTLERDASRLYADGVLAKETALRFVADESQLRVLAKEKKKGLWG